MKKILFAYLFVIAFYLFLIIGGIYVAIHFLRKIW